MKARLTLLLSLLLLSQPLRADWLGDKYSLFIHYGLYSTYGGVYDGVPVRDGYSEQIFSFGVHYMDLYEEAMADFTAERFDADLIVALARRAGMRSVVLTSKHHEGFCLWDTETTDFSSVRAPKCGRDLVGELSRACHRAGIGFGIYFSLIDWHYPQAMPYTSHNADPATPEHHLYNMRQVTELLTRYGEVDELWFDMGSLTPDQSREMYHLVKRLQPGCMVSGRLGNDCADFAVFPDNAAPDYAMDIPWQSAASFFPETWGYRSWQQRGSVGTKVREKLSDLLHVVSGGGKYLLNIGPMGDGAVVPFEAEVLQRIGVWLEANGQAVYGTRGFYSAGPYMTQSEDGRTLYLFVPDDQPVVELPPLTQEPASVTALDGENGVSSVLMEGRRVVRCTACAGSPYRVVALSFDVPVALQPADGVMPIYAYSLADYYAGLRSIVGYRYSGRPVSSLLFPEEYAGREVELSGQVIRLSGEPERMTSPRVSLRSLRSRGVGGQLGRMPERGEVAEWADCDATLLGDTLYGRPQHHGGLLYEGIVESKSGGLLRVDLSYQGGFLLYLNGRYIDGGYSRVTETLPLLLPLEEGRNVMELKLYNAYGTQPRALLTPCDRYRVLTRQIAPSDDVTLKRPHRFPLASPAHLSALRVR